ncbi:uncharacterized protein [Amphiura filiformis]|uniref:uncharacterized protein n=1 Tax=Amphiura filiformis TaxID=82378 RepID=UPI003B21F84C
MAGNRYHGDAYQSEWYHSGRELCDAINRGDVELRFGDRLEMEMLDSKAVSAKLYYHWGIVSCVSDDPYECFSLDFSAGNSSLLGSSSSMASSSNSSKSSKSLNSLSNSKSSKSLKSSNSFNPLRVFSDLYSLEDNKIANFQKKIRVNNSKDSKTQVLSEAEIRARIDAVRAVPSLMGPYDIASNNCEHFVNYIRYDKKESAQVRKTVVTTVAVAASGCVIG